MGHAQQHRGRRPRGAEGGRGGASGAVAVATLALLWVTQGLLHWLLGEPGPAPSASVGERWARDEVEHVRRRGRPWVPAREGLAGAEPRMDARHWLPPAKSRWPQVRLGPLWINPVWFALPAGVALLIGILAAMAARRLEWMQHFLAAYPGTVAVAVTTGFPGWLRWTHFFNLFFMFLIIRSGIQILADHPRLYWDRNCTPGREWFRFREPVPGDRLWTSKDDAVTIPGWLGIPGVRHAVGPARWWHFGSDLLWLVNGVVFYALLFSTGQWKRLVPLSWKVFPNAASAVIQYLSLNFPPNLGWTNYNGLQQLVYFVTVFLAAPLAVFTGLMQSPAVANRLAGGRTLHRQAARSIHFLVLCWFVFFIVTHIIMVFITGWLDNLSHMFWGANYATYAALWVFCGAMALVILVWVAATPFTLRHTAVVQQVGMWLVGWIKGIAERWDTTAEYGDDQIAPYFWANGHLPTTPEYRAMFDGGFADWRLRVDGLVQQPRSFTLAQLQGMAKQEQTTMHFCIQGWSGVAKWGGVPMRHILELVQPRPEARFAVFYSMAPGSEGGRYYDVHELRNMDHRQTILAYEQNGAPLTVLHGAPLRLRCENELGFKQVKWIERIEFVSEFRSLGGGRGGYNEDHEFYGWREPI